MDVVHVLEIPVVSVNSFSHPIFTGFLFVHFV